jgi:hypothetical protein
MERAMVHFQETVRGLVASGVLGAAFLAGTPANATTYVIATDSMSATSAPGCGFVEAVGAINAGKGQNGCAAPTGTDRIELRQDSPIENSTENDGPYVATTQLLIKKSMTIVGKGMNSTSIKIANGIRVDTTAGVPVTVALEDLALVKHDQQVATAPGIGAYGSTTLTLDLTLTRVRAAGFANTNTAAVHVSSPTVPGDALFTMVTVEESLVTGNIGPGIKTLGNGAGIFLHRTTLSSNQNRGLHIENARTELHFSTIENNTTSGHGGGIYMITTCTPVPPELDCSTDPEDQSNITIYNSLVSNNTAGGGDGGGIYFAGRNGIDIQRTTISGNKSGDAPATGRGGGLFTKRAPSSPSYLQIRNSTIAFNRARSHGGGIWDDNGGNGTPLTAGVIVAKNTLGTSTSSSANPSPNGTDIYFSGGQGLDAYHSLFGTRQGAAFVCFDITPPPEYICPPNRIPATPGGMIDPLLTSLKFLGGATRVHALQSSSLALDYSDCNVNATGADQRGFKHAVDYNFDQDAFLCDIGAFEAGGYDMVFGDDTLLPPSGMTYTEAGTGLKYLEVFITKSDGHVYQKRAEILPTGELSEWDPPGAYEFVTASATAFGPSVVALPNNQAYILVTSNGELWAQKRLSNYGLAPWEFIGSFVASGPAAVDVNGETWAFVRGTDNHFLHAATFSGWVGWYQVPMGPTFQGEPGAAYLSGSNRMYVFGRKSDSQAAFRYYNRATGLWNSSWVNLPGVINSNIAAVARSSTQIDLYALNLTGQLLVGTLNSTGFWTGWSLRPNSSGGGMFTGPGASSRGNGTLDVFMITPTFKVEHQQTPWW